MPRTERVADALASRQERVRTGGYGVVANRTSAGRNNNAEAMPAPGWRVTGRTCRYPAPVVLSAHPPSASPGEARNESGCLLLYLDSEPRRVRRVADRVVDAAPQSEEPGMHGTLSPRPIPVGDADATPNREAPPSQAQFPTGRAGRRLGVHRRARRRVPVLVDRVQSVNAGPVDGQPSTAAQCVRPSGVTRGSGREDDRAVGHRGRALGPVW